MKQRMKISLTILAFLITGLASGQSGKPVTEYLGIPGPVVINNVSFSLAWSAHPSPAYYKQEYIGVNDNLQRFKKMVLAEVLTGDAKPADLAKAKMAELDQLKKSNPMVNYEVFQKNGEVLLDFLLSENSADGKTIIVLERNVYRYRAFADKAGKKGVMLFGVSERSYGKEADAFLSSLKKNKAVLLNAVAGFSIPEVSLKN